MNHNTLTSQSVTHATSALERTRCLEAELEASLLFASSVLEYPNGITSLSSMMPADASSSGAIMEVHPENGITNNTSSSNIANATTTSASELNLPGGVKDAWLALSSAIALDDVDDDTITATTTGAEAAMLGKGQLSKAITNTIFSQCLHQSHTIAQQLISQSKTQAQGHGKSGGVQDAIEALEVALGNVASTGGNTLDVYLDVFYSRLLSVREYHARHDTARNKITTVGEEFGITSASNGIKRRRTKYNYYGHPEADGYDLASMITSGAKAVCDGQVFTVEEVFGKYLDLSRVHDTHVVACSSLRSLFVNAFHRTKGKKMQVSPSAKEDEQGSSGSALPYIEFLLLLNQPLFMTVITEQEKLDCRKKYIRFVSDLKQYMEDFISKTEPLMDISKDLVHPAEKSFFDEWKDKGCVAGWSVSSDRNISETGSDLQSPPINMEKFASADELENELGGDGLKIELMKRGMKCGGTPKDRAKRLFMAKGVPLHELPKKVFVGNKVPEPSQSNDIRANTIASGESRIDIARLEAVTVALLDHLRPKLDATCRRADRRITQSTLERETEMKEEINGALSSLQEVAAKNEIANAESDDEDAPIYNPKGVPLDFDGKPIPYWLFKLHGLNHYFPCEICGNETYRGRMNFEKHFTEAKHIYGMKCLGIPNTKHFHGVTQIADAQKLWESLQEKLDEEKFDRSKEEEFEDSHGNVLSLTTYEDLARQGLL